MVAFICCALWLVAFVWLESSVALADDPLPAEFETVQARHAQIVSIQTRQNLYVLVELSDEPSAMQAERIAAELLSAEIAQGRFVYVNFYVNGRFVFQLYKDRAADGKYAVSRQDFY